MTRKSSRPGKKTPQGIPKLADRDLKNASPLTSQFPPTESQPLKQHHQMAGMKL